MNLKIQKFTSCAIALLMSSTITLFASFCGGNGTIDNPYLICDAIALDHLHNTLSSQNGYAGRYFKLTNDITGTPYTVCIGGGTTAFRGIFDGNGYEINLHLHYTNPGTYIGLFGWISGAVIKNLTVSGSVVGGGSVGGIAGALDASDIRNCLNLASVSSSNNSDNIGGIGGFGGANTTIIECANGGKIFGYSNVAGIIGNASKNNHIHRCVNVGTIIAIYWNAGGIAGSNGVNITYCFNSGYIEADDKVGGLLGASWSNSATISNSLNVGVVKARDAAPTAAGAIVGLLNAPSNVSYSLYDNQMCTLPALGEFISTAALGRTTNKLWAREAISTLGGGWDYEVFGTPNINACAGGNRYYPTIIDAGNKMQTQTQTNPYKINQIKEFHSIAVGVVYLPERDGVLSVANNIRGIRYLHIDLYLNCSSYWVVDNNAIINVGLSNNPNYIKDVAANAELRMAGNTTIRFRSNGFGTIIEREVPVRITSISQNKIGLTTEAEATTAFSVSEVTPNIVTANNATIDITTAAESNLNVAIYDLAGSKIMDVVDEFVNENSTKKIDLNNLSNLATGSYVVIVKSANDVAVRKFIKQP